MWPGLSLVQSCDSPSSGTGPALPCSHTVPMRVDAGQRQEAVVDHLTPNSRAVAQRLLAGSWMVGLLWRSPLYVGRRNPVREAGTSCGAAPLIQGPGADLGLRQGRVSQSRSQSPAAPA